MSKNQKPIIPVFFGCDNRFVPYMSVALRSMIDHASANRKFEVHILHTDISKENQAKVQTMAKRNIQIVFDDVSDDIRTIVNQLPVRDYYSVSTYFRLVIAEKFPQYDKAIYIDCDTATVEDVSKLYDINMGNKYVAAVPEAVMDSIEECGRYAEKVLGINRHRYFNAGMIVINCKKWREVNVLQQFIDLVGFYDFTIAQDQDYLNVICKDKVYYLPRRWNMECIHGWRIGEKRRGIIHYAFAAKPWHDVTTIYGNYFWESAAKTPFFMEIKAAYAAYTPEQLAKENALGGVVAANCLKEIRRPDNFLKRCKKAAHARDHEEVYLPLLPLLQEIALVKA